MLLLCLSLSLFCVCSSVERSMCYGSHYTLDLGFYGEDFRGSVFFTPTNGGVKRLVMKNGKSMDPRFRTNSDGGLVMSGLTEQDNGNFSVILNSGSQPNHLTTLLVSDCTDTETNYCGNVFSLRVPRGAEFLEFTPDKKLEQVTVVWNRTDPNGGRGSVTGSYWEITNITQEDSGYYKFRGKHNRLVTWKRLSVKENEKVHYLQEGESLQMECPAKMWTVTFEPLKVMGHHAPMEIRLRRFDTGSFKDRMEFRGDAIVVDPVKAEDSGVFKFRDVKGNLIQRVDVNVTMYEIPVWMYALFVTGVIFGMIFCCCCIKKCCYKKSSSKRNNPAPQSAAAPDVYYHAVTQPTHPKYSRTSPARVYSHQPVTPPPIYAEPTSTSGGPPVAAPGGQGTTPLPSNPSDVISSNSGPQFELKGLYFSSASPLSSDSAITDVYSSDKLNFL
ncbi:uncharacterized protein LOC115426618 [Sphaeramia orbicularis]|uniref:uncharacterized protein LOC115426618 n=1 Tax=Sphaeramia orbicularis TaxID=375764 RepID=UPI0011802637|nr:uncharacterized protein LOC115426618 [Sphaeramia orbicularis]